MTLLNFFDLFYNFNTYTGEKYINVHIYNGFDYDSPIEMPCNECRAKYGRYCVSSFGDDEVYLYDPEISMVC